MKILSIGYYRMLIKKNLNVSGVVIIQQLHYQTWVSEIEVSQCIKKNILS